MPKTKKIIFTLCLAVFIAGGIFVLSATPARAGWLDIVTSPGGFVYSILGALAMLLFKAANFFVQIAATLLEVTFSIEKFTDVAVVKAGWQICRDIANIGFVLVLLVLAFDSVLNLNKYQIKTTMPRLVIAALLINFSLVFCAMIIDFSQIMTHYFYEAAIGGNPEGLSGQLAGALNIQSVYKEPAGNWGGEIKESGPMSIIIGILFGTAILLVAAFSIAAAAIFFIGRIVTLWLLMIFAPIAWVSMIVPNAPEIGGYWNKWWGEFLKWTFFAPVYMFFIYLAVMIASTAPVTSDNAAAAAQNSLLKDSVISGFFSNGIYTVLQYIAIILILIMGLKYAQSSGAKGAAIVMGAGAAAAGWAKKKTKQYTTDKAVQAGQWGYAKAGEMSARAGNKIFSAVGLENSKWAGRMRAKGEQLRQKGYSDREKTEGNKAYTNLLGTMSEKDLLSEVNKGSGIRKLIAARQAKEKGLLEKADPETVREAMKTFNAYGPKDPLGKSKEARELEELRFDAILDKEERENAIRRAKESGNLEKIKKIAVSTPEAMDSLRGALTPAEFTEVFKKWGGETKKAAEAAMIDGFTDTFSGEDIKKRELFASCTGKISEAFTNKTTGGVNYRDAGNYVLTMSAPQITATHNDKDLQIIGENITVGQLTSAAKNLSGKQQKQIKEGARKSSNQAVVDHVSGKTGNAGWANT